MQDTTKYPFAVRLAIILGFPVLFWSMTLMVLTSSLPLTSFSDDPENHIKPDEDAA